MPEINAGNEQIGASVTHDARDEERRFGRYAIRRVRSDHRKADDMAVALPLINICRSQRGDAVLQHCAGIGIDDTFEARDPASSKGRTYVPTAGQRISDRKLVNGSEIEALSIFGGTVRLLA